MMSLLCLAQVIVLLTGGVSGCLSVWTSVCQMSVLVRLLLPAPDDTRSPKLVCSKQWQEKGVADNQGEGCVTLWCRPIPWP